MSKLEEVARALYFDRHSCFGEIWPEWDDLSKGRKQVFLGQARAAIEAMRTLTPDMLEAGCAAYEPSLGEDRFVSETGIERVWNAMLARAIKDAAHEQA